MAVVIYKCGGMYNYAFYNYGKYAVLSRVINRYNLNFSEINPNIGIKQRFLNNIINIKAVNQIDT